MSRLLAVAFAGILATGLALAQSKTPFGDLGDDSDKPIHIYCDGGQEFDFNAETSTCKVARIEQGEMILRADTVLAEAPGSKLTRITASGDVIVTSKDATARAPRAVYETEARMIRLSGGVVLTQGGNTLRGTDLVVDLKAGTAVLTSTGGRVEGILQPGSVKGQ
ncbi:MAG: LptA/OstA family protein [Micropepsaceae bacterium]